MTPGPLIEQLLNATRCWQAFDTAPAVTRRERPRHRLHHDLYGERAAIAIADTDLSITDPDTANLESATIVLTNAKAGDVLSIAGALPAGIDAPSTPRWRARSRCA